jgi:O-antigen/teichoic acid export membrane protein
MSRRLDDVIWNYAATILKISSYLFLLPFILNKFPSELVGVWSIFMAVGSISAVLDFGFNVSFTRSVTYVFNGVKSLSKNGLESSTYSKEVSFELLSNLISSMKWFYRRMALFLFLLLVTLGTFYIVKICNQYKGSNMEILIPWILFCILNTFSIYSSYLDILLIGSGKLKQQKVFLVFGNVAFICISIFLIQCGFKLSALIIGQLISVVIIRILSYRSFYTLELKTKITKTVKKSTYDLIKVLFPNALKSGLTSIGGLLIQKSSVIIGSVYISLAQIGGIGITMQIMTLVSSISSIYISSHLPLITSNWVRKDTKDIREIYLKGIIISAITYVFAGIILISFSGIIFNFFNKGDMLPNHIIILLFLILSFIETFISLTGMILMARNEVPFFWSSILSGFAVVIFLLLSFEYISESIFIIVLVPMFVDLSYQAWKWPKVLFKLLN